MALAARNNLAKLPGMTFGEEMHRERFHKPHVLQQKDQGTKLPTPTDVAEFGTWDIDGAKDTTFWQTSSKRSSERVWGTEAERDLLSSGSGKPVSLERKVLRFRAFFREPVHDSAVEQWRTRVVFIHYYLEDDTIAVSEPRQDNSGIAGQGSFIKRHQIPKPDGSDIYTYEDFNIDVDVSLYGRVFRTVDCDAFTRRFLEQLGREVPSSMDIPQDQYTTTRRIAREAMSARKQKQGNDMDYGVQRSGITADEIIKTQQFLAHDKEVLRFSCVWDDRENPHGDKRYFRLYYFLADDTIEIIEIEQVNGGRDPFPSFVKRKRIPKPQEGRYQSPVPGLFVQNNGVEYYTDSDLRIGARLKVFGREFVVYDCDSFTQDHLSQAFGVRDFTPLHINAAVPATSKKDAPPHNGFGTEEDSLNSWKYLVPSTKASRRHIKPELADACLKFQLRFSHADAANSARRFVVTYYLGDNTLSIFEPAQPNAGLVGGKFLNRQKVRRVRPDGIPTGENIAAQDFYLGANITINTHKFTVYGTDERTLVYMEEHPNEFLHSNLMLVLRRLRAHCTPSTFAHADTDHNGTLDYCEFARLMEELSLPLKEHEILTVMRHFDKNGDGRVSVRELQQALGSA